MGMQLGGGGMSAAERARLESVESGEVWEDGAVGYVLTLDGDLVPVWEEASGGGGGVDVADVSGAYSALLPGRTISTNFANQARTEKLFDVTGGTYGTDAAESSRACISPTATDGTALSILTKDKFTFANSDTRIRFRIPAGAHTASDVKGYARYLDINNNASLVKLMNPVQNLLAAATIYEGSGGNLGSYGSADVTAGVHYMRIRVIGTLVQVKTWLKGATEPDWQISRQMANGSNWIEDGVNGAIFKVYNAGWKITDISVTELLPTPEVLANPDLTLYNETTSLPAFWGKTTPTGGAVLDTVTNKADRRGVTGRKLMHASRGSAAAQSLQFSQAVYSLSGSNFFPGTYARNYPAVPGFGPALELTIASKADDMEAGATNFLGLAVVLAHADEDFNALNGVDATYYASLGPSGAVALGGGFGTWDWTVNVLRIRLREYWRVNWMNLTIGFHDVDCTGEAWFEVLGSRFVS